MMHARYTLIVLALGVVLAACANPADDKPAATIGDAVDAPEASADAAETTMTLTDASKLNFIGSKVTGSHDGGFNEFSGTGTLAGNTAESATVDITIDTTSLWSDNDRLTGHLKSADFFDVEKFPEASFVTTSVAKTDEGYDVTGNLTLHGVTKSISFPAQIELADGSLTARAEFHIDRKAFDINYPGKPDDLIRDEVVISFDIEAKA